MDGIPTVLCLVAFRSPRLILVYRLEREIDPCIFVDIPIDTDVTDMDTEDKSESEINSIDLLYQADKMYLFLGMRDGFVVSFEICFFPEFSFGEKSITRFGNSQVGFFSPSHHLSKKTSMFVSCEYLWEVRPINGHLQIEEVLFDNIRAVVPLLLY
jgi:hypothetical protein